MGIHWLAVLCASALLARASLALPEEEPVGDEISEELPQDYAEHVRNRRQSPCNDLLDYCAQWPDSYCKTFPEYMKKNCPKKCGHCSVPTQPPTTPPTQPPDCTDKDKYCSHWKAYGYCNKSSKYYDYMKGNCKKSCDFCGDGGGGSGSCSGSESSKVKGCKFDSDTCDWHNVPFDDEQDFVIKSSDSGGPSSGAGGSGKFLVTERSRGNAQLLLPLELVLEAHDSDYGTMCLQLNFFMRGGTLKVIDVANRKGSDKTALKTISGDQGSRWKCISVKVQVSVHHQILLEASASGSVIAIDDISFAESGCK